MIYINRKSKQETKQSSGAENYSNWIENLLEDSKVDVSRQKKNQQIWRWDNENYWIWGTESIKMEEKWIESKGPLR